MVLDMTDIQYVPIAEVKNMIGIMDVINVSVRRRDTLGSSLIIKNSLS